MKKIFTIALFACACNAYADNEVLTRFDIHYLPDAVTGQALFASESKVHVTLKGCNTFKYTFTRNQYGWQQENTGISTRKLCINDNRDAFINYFMEGFQKIDYFEITSHQKAYPLTPFVKMY